MVYIPQFFNMGYQGKIKIVLIVPKDISSSRIVEKYNRRRRMYNVLRIFEYSESYGFFNAELRIDCSSVSKVTP